MISKQATILRIVWNVLMRSHCVRGAASPALRKPNAPMKSSTVALPPFAST